MGGWIQAVILVGIVGWIVVMVSRDLIADRRALPRMREDTVENRRRERRAQLFHA